MTEESCGWLVVSVSTAGGAASLRVQVWRKLRLLGALYLQQSVCLLPAADAVTREMRRLVDRVVRGGGTARVLHMRFREPGEEQAVVGEFNAARDGEYAEILERLPELHRELESERARGRATYAEVEESEADLARFHTWLAKIEARDYFAAPVGDAARAAVVEAVTALAAFEQAALSLEAPESEPPAGASQAGAPVAGRELPRLRAVDGT